MIDQYYNRFQPGQNYEQIAFRADRVLQSAELNEIQSASNHRLQGIADALFKDGDLVRDARVIVNADTGAARCESGAIYLKGAVRGVAPASLQVATAGIVVIGIYLQQVVVTELEAPELRNPAANTRGFEEPGAARIRFDTHWGVSGDGQSGEFYPVYTVEDGVLRAKEPPPQLDSVTQAIARYDRDNSGGSYVVSGLNVAAAADLPTGDQVYTVAEGRARINGYPVEFATSRRLIYPATPDLRYIDNEPHISTTANAQRITLDRAPLADITKVSITMDKTDTITHAGFTGSQDPLPNTSVLSISQVKQGSTIYVAGTDYKLTAGKVDWSLPGAEPAPGSTYSVTYQCITNVQPTAVDSTGLTVTGAVAGTQILVSYNQKLPRVDRLCIDAQGALTWIKGVAADWNPTAPSIPTSMLPLATVIQTWSAGRSVVTDGVRTVSMSELTAMNTRLDWLTERIAEQRLQGDISLREAGIKKGLFVDPFLNDSLRDAGIPQTAAIVAGELTLPIVASVAQMASDVPAPTAPAYTLVPVLEQALRTGSMKVNPYQAFDPIPADVKLTPAIDRWTDVTTTWASTLTERVVVGSGDASSVTSTSNTALLSSTSKAAETLRTIDVSFTVAGFGPNEALGRLTFDGIDVAAFAA